MALFRNIRSILHLRGLSTKAKCSIKLDQNTNDEIENNLIKPRHHAGVDKSKCIELPEEFLNAMEKSLKDHPPKSVWKDGLILNRYLRARHPPTTQMDLQRKQRELEKHVLDSCEVDINLLDDDRRKFLEYKNEQKVKKLMKQRIYSWKPIDYDEYKCLQYLLVRSAPEYSTILRTFSDISKRNPNFVPRSFFDFGSGIGTGIWAASKLWQKSIFEYYLVDASRDMNNLADLLLRDGEENKELMLKNVNFRQFLPSSEELKYDIVLCAYSLLELPDVKTRLETIQKLWNKCDGYLVIIEQGTRAGYKLINEARDFVMYMSRESKNAHIFSPCAHDLACPRFVADDGTPCNFLSTYKPLPIGAINQSEQKHEVYSYVVIKKITNQMEHDKDVNGNSSSNGLNDERWPRLVRPTLVRAKHSICRMCTNNGKLEEIIFTQSKHGKNMYRCARSSKWGDRLPINLENLDLVEEKEDKHKNK